MRTRHGDSRYAEGAGATTRRLTCASNDGKRTRCGIPSGTASVRLARQLSSADCVRGRTWDTERGSLWVDKGCRAEFAVSGSGGGDDDEDISTPPATGSRVTCGSSGDARRECPVRGRIDEVKLRRDLSGGACLRGGRWGHSDTAIWTRDGCVGEFEVKYR